MSNIWQILNLLPSVKSRLAKIVFLNTLLGLASASIPFILKFVIDQITELSLQKIDLAVAERQILFLVGVYFAIRILVAGTDYLLEKIGDTLFMDVMWQLRDVVFQHILTMPLDYFDRTRTGEITEKMQNVREVALWLVGVTNDTLQNILTIVVILVILWIKAPLVGLVMTISLPVSIYLVYARVGLTRPLRKQWHQIAEQSNGEVSETISHMATVKSFNQEDTRLDRYKKLTKEFKSVRLQTFRVDWSVNFWRKSIGALGFTTAFAIVAMGTLKGHYTLGDIYLIWLYIQQINGSSVPLGKLVLDTGEATTAAERVTDLLEQKSTLIDSPNAQPLTVFESLEFDNVSFAYPGKEGLAIEQVSFKLEAKKTLAIVGPSGVGKTTIAKLIARFYSPTQGQILVNGQPIENFTQSSVRSQLGLVMQDSALFNETVEANLAFANPTASQLELEASAKAAYADVFIEKLPEKYKTIIGERGVKLSGGERQRIAIARAILKDPPLVILDEATSSLDSHSEQQVQSGIKNLLKNKAAIIIAHRLSTVMNADKIIVLRDGKVSETGTHQDLMNKKGLYAKLHNLQTEGLLVA